MFTLAFLTLSLLCGAALHRLTMGARSAAALERMTEIAILSLAAPSFVGIVLAALDLFEPQWIVLGLLIVTTALGGAVVLAAPPGGNCSERPRPKSPVWITAVIIALAVWLRAPAINYVRGGQDPGVYVNIANSLARTGRLEISDPLAPPLADKTTELGRMYFKNSYRALSCRTPDACRGAFQPGFYLRGINPSKITPQFYHLHPIWMAYSALALGGQHTTTILLVFGILSILLLYLLTAEICCRWWSAPLAGALLALSPAHAYFSRFPVSEITASVFFLGAMLYIVRSRGEKLPLLLAGSLFTGLFCFTHITGFMLLAILFPVLVLAAARHRGAGRPTAQLAAWMTALGLFLWSYYHGLAFSRPYSMTIWEKIGVPDAALRWTLDHPLGFTIPLVLVTSLPFLLVPLVMRRLPAALRTPPSHSLLGWAAIAGLALFIGFLAYKAWLLGWTDHYAPHRWIGRRWGLAGQGLDSIKHMTAVVLGYFVSPAVLITALAGWVWMSRRVLSSPGHCIIFTAITVFSLALVGRQMTVPYLYYFGRYVASALVPLTILAGVYGIERLRFPSRRLTMVCRLTFITAAFLHLLPYSAAQARSNEAAELYSELHRLTASLAPRPLLFVDEVNFATVELTTPLFVTFGVPVVVYSRRDYTGEPLRRLMNEAAVLGYSVYLLSEKDRGTLLPFLREVGDYSFHLGSLIPAEGSIMPTITRSGRQRAFLHHFTPEAPVEPR